jgi:hypothetical protein
LSVAVKLGGFLLLLVAVFAGAYAAGARVGPVVPGPAHTSSPAPASPGGGMNMGGMP